SVPDPLSARALLGWAGGQPWGRSASSAVAATPRRQTRCLLVLIDEALGGYAHVSQCEAPLPVALRLDLLLGGDRDLAAFATGRRWSPSTPFHFPRFSSDC